jgi:hypothetical protein
MHKSVQTKRDLKYFEYNTQYSHAEWFKIMRV